jgi:hypothetical protein
MACHIVDAAFWASNGSLFVGAKGILYLGRGGRAGRRYVLLPEKDFEGFQPPPKTILRAPGGDHMKDWIEGIKQGRPAGSNFESTPLDQARRRGGIGAGGSPGAVRPSPPHG